ncbi:putative protein OS=Afipia felis OX=1035 GN=NCTC12722_00855 PE=4 SV=1 [Afipia felis]
MRFSASAFPAALATLAMLAVSPAAFAQAKPETAAPAQSSPQAPASEAAPAQVQQIALTEKQIQNLLAAQQEMNAITDKLPEDVDGKPDPAVQAQFEAITKKHGFASFDEFSDVATNVALVLSGIDPKTKTFSEPPVALKKQIAAVSADKSMPEKDKQAMLADMNEALKYAVNVQYPENVTLVTKYYDKLNAMMQNEE